MPATTRRNTKHLQLRPARPVVLHGGGVSWRRNDAASNMETTMGRPSSYSDEVADIICERIAQGEALHRMCGEDAGLPSERTVYRWLEEHDDFRQKYARARDRQADRYAAEIVQIADTATDANLARLQVDARKWASSKLAPKKYGDKAEVAHTGADGGPIKTETITPLEAARQVAFALALGQQALKQSED